MLFTKFLTALLCLIGDSFVEGFTPGCWLPEITPVKQINGRRVTKVEASDLASFNRRKILHSAALSIPIGLGPPPASATGRATLEQAVDRYLPRIIAGGAAYKGELAKAISSGSSAKLYAVVKEPRAKNKSDNSKNDGGYAERAASAGPFSDARVLNAMDLYASTFSDRSTTPKTKSMKSQVSELRKIVNELDSMSKSGDKFDVKRAKEIYKQGGDAFNNYCYIANEGLNVKMKRLTFL
ncbi:hypothetical protein TrLO_g10007 [Triparma laevis f. longispina]|uniref:Uncharacterized protein n=1 Tax=Triparma laevis f. longispina TaxID=1714387 RepID=A0A9W6ZR48_9STRA|nr:hypothetical protein TrLO_g10007 [Triparma laevis f. longispina]